MLRYDRLDNTLVAHGVGNFEETGDVGSLYIVDIAVGLGTIHAASLMDVLHDVMQAGIHFLAAPIEAHGVLSHFQTAGGDTTGVGSLARGKEDLGIQEYFHSLGGGRHVRGFADAEAAVLNEVLGVFLVQFVLSGTGDRDIHGNLPGPLAGEELGIGELLGIVDHAVVVGSAEFKHIVDLLSGYAVFVVDIAVGT